MKNNKMKTIEQKTEEYLKSIYKECFDDPCYTPDVAQSKKDFLSGYQAANEWISVDDELPENETPLIAKNNYGGTINYNYVFYETIEEREFKSRYTHWKPIE